MLYVKHASPLSSSELLFNGNSIAEALFADAPDAVFILGGNTYSIIDCNPKALQLFEVESKSSIIHLPSFRLYESEPTEFSQGIQENNLRNLGEHSQEMVFRTFKQNIFWGKLVKRSLKFDDKEYIILRVNKAVDYLRTEEAMSTLLRGTARVTGKKYFKELTRLLCKTFDVKVAFVGKLSNNKKEFEVIESCGSITPKVPFKLKVQGSVLENSTRGYTTFYPSGTSELFPNNKFVKQNNIEGFMGTPIFGNSGEVIGMIAIVHDKPLQEIPNSRHILSFFASRTAAEIYRMRSKALLKEQASKLSMANSLKDKLLSTISHDLMNPLHSVMGYFELFHHKMDSYSKEEIMERMELVDNSVKNIYFLLENVKSWLNIYNDRVRPRTEQVSLSGVVDENINLFKYIFALKELKVNINIDKNSIIEADKYMISSIIRNLLSNAVKYTPKGGVVEINTKTVNDQIELVIKDNGIGVSGDDMEYIMSASPVSDKDDSDSIVSADMGLVIAKKYAEWLHGSFNIKSSVDEGTICTINFPSI